MCDMLRFRRRDSNRSITRSARLLLGSLVVTTACSVVPRARAADEPSPAAAAPRQPIHLEDSDKQALFELRDESGGTYRCVGRCDLTAIEGRYHVRVAHGGSVDETDILLTRPTTLRGRPSSYVGVGLGIPTILGGLVTGLIGLMTVSFAGNCMDDCSAAELRAADAQAPGQRRDGYLLIGAGVLAIGGGIWLITTSHGSSLTAVDGNTEQARSGSFGVALLPKPGGASLSFGGSF
jgi:hypothetical protein